MHHLAGAVNKIRRLTLTGSSPNHTPTPTPVEEEEGEEEVPVEAPDDHSPSSRRRFVFGLVNLGSERRSSSSKSGSSKSSPDPRPSEAIDKPSRRKSTGKNRSAESGPASLADHALDWDSVAKHSADVKHAMDSRRPEARHSPYRDHATRQDNRYQEGGNKHNAYSTSGWSSEEDGATNKATRSPEREREVGSTQQSPQLTGLQQQRAPEAVAGQTSQVPDATLHRYYALEMLGYEVGSQIGKGSYAVVRKAVHIQSGRMVAVKIVTKAKCPPDFLNKFLPRELTALRTLQHPNLITVYNITESQSRFYIIMDVATGGDLLDKIRSHRRLQEANAGRYFAGLVAGMLYVHSHNIVHRDLKCENLLLDHKDQVRITDFGFSRSVWTQGDKVSLSTTFCGSFAYAAPEVLKAKPYNPFKSDVWSIGVILYTMVTGKLPFDDKDHKLLLTLVHEPVKFPESVVVTKAFKDIVCEILNPSPQDRISLQDIPNLQWFASFGFGADIPRLQRVPAAEQSQSSTTSTDQSSFETDSSSSNASGGRQQQLVAFPSPHPLTMSVRLPPSPPLLANQRKAAAARNERQRAVEAGQVTTLNHPLTRPHVNHPLTQPQVKLQPSIKPQSQPPKSFSPPNQKLGDVKADSQTTSCVSGKPWTASPVFQSTLASRPLSSLHHTTQPQIQPPSLLHKQPEAAEAGNQTTSCLSGNARIPSAVYHGTQINYRPEIFTTLFSTEQQAAFGPDNFTEGFNRIPISGPNPPQQPTGCCGGWDNHGISGQSPLTQSPNAFIREKQTSFPTQRPRSAEESRRKPILPVSLRAMEQAATKLHLDTHEKHPLQPQTAPLTSQGLLPSNAAVENDTAIIRNKPDLPFSREAATPAFKQPSSQTSADMGATKVLHQAGFYRHPQTNRTHVPAVISGDASKTFSVDGGHKSKESPRNDRPVFLDETNRSTHQQDGSLDPLSSTPLSAQLSRWRCGAQRADEDKVITGKPPATPEPRSPECSGTSCSSCSGSSETSTRTSRSQSTSASDSDQQAPTPSGSGA